MNWNIYYRVLNTNVYGLVEEIIQYRLLLLKHDLTSKEWIRELGTSVQFMASIQVFCVT